MSLKRFSAVMLSFNTKVKVINMSFNEITKQYVEPYRKGKNTDSTHTVIAIHTPLL